MNRGFVGRVLVFVGFGLFVLTAFAGLPVWVLAMGKTAVDPNFGPVFLSTLGAEIVVGIVGLVIFPRPKPQ